MTTYITAQELKDKLERELKDVTGNITFQLANINAPIKSKDIIIINYNYYIFFSLIKIIIIKADIKPNIELK